MYLLGEMAYYKSMSGNKKHTGGCVEGIVYDLGCWRIAAIEAVIGYHVVLRAEVA